MSSRHSSFRWTATWLLLIVSLLNIAFWIVYMSSPAFRVRIYRLLMRDWGLPADPPELGFYHWLALLVWLWAAASCVWELSRIKRRTEAPHI